MPSALSLKSVEPLRFWSLLYTWSGRYISRIVLRSPLVRLKYEIRNSFGQLNEAIFGDTDFAKLITKARLPQAELDEVELVKLQAWLRQGLNIWMSIETAYNKGMTPRETYGIMFDDLKFIIDSIPAARPVLRELVEYYPALSDTALFVAINDRLAKYQT
jgi:hypothetical protein